MEEQLNFDLVACYLAGECDVDEIHKVESWMQADPNNKSLMEEYRKIWEASGADHEGFNEWFDVEEDWEELRNRIEEEGKRSGSVSTIRHLKSNYTKIAKARFTQVFRVAAIILVAAFLGVLSYQNLYEKPKVAEPVLREISMDKGQRGNVTLSDGTKVILNAESKVILPNTFKSDKREITLKGEAFLDVSHDPDRPFVISVGDAVVEVLGTSFSVRSYPEDESVQVVVRDGKVSLGSKKKSANENAVLSAGEMGQLNTQDYHISKQAVNDMDLFLGWKEGWLKFKDTSMDKVARELERKYDVEITFADESLKDLKLTAELKSRTFKRNLDAISVSLGIEYRMDQEVATFYHEKK